MKNSLFGKLLEIDLSRFRVHDLNIRSNIIFNFLGGKGLGAYLLYTRLIPHTDPLSPANLFMILNGPLTGTAFPTSGRTVIITKSPLTGLFLDSHTGGYLGPEIKKMGYDGIVITGVSGEHIYLYIENGQVEFRDASEIWGLTLEKTIETIRKNTNKTAHIAAIGPAGENLVKIAAVMIDKDTDPWRAGIAARGGPGAVMGSKNLKAIAIKGTENIELNKDDNFRKLSSQLHKKIRNVSFVHTRRTLGTAYWVDPMNRFGILPTRNFQQGFIEFHYGLIASNLRYYVKRDVSCYNCPIVCGKLAKVGETSVKVEYEDIAMLGSNNGITDIIDVARALALCNNLGLDAISTGGVIAFAMECAERGLLKNTLKFGDAQAQRKLIEDIAYKRGLGAVLADGAKRAAEKIGHDTNKFAIHVKGLELPGYEPRSSWGMALAYATADRGGCHQRAWTTGAEVDGKLHRFSTKNIAEFVKFVQDERAVAYSLVVCDFAPLSVSDYIENLKYAIQFAYTPQEYLKVGERIWNLIRLFNLREAKLSKKDDTLPPRMFEDPLPMPPDGQEKIRLSKNTFNAMLEHYYSLRGWDENGIPTKEKLKELNLDKL